MAKKDTRRTPAIEEEILDRLSGGETLRSICRDEHMPSWRAVYQWIDGDEDFATRIAHARDRGFDAIACDVVDIIDDGRNDWMEKLGKDRKPIGWQLNGEHVQRSRLRAETRLKLLAKWCPSRYGERAAMEISGPEGGPVQTDDVQLAARLASIFETAKRKKEASDEEEFG